MRSSQHDYGTGTLVPRVTIFLFCTFLSVPELLAQYSCTVTARCPNAGCARVVGGWTKVSGPYNFRSPGECQSQAAAAQGVSVSCNCQAIQPMASSEQPDISSNTPAQPDPEAIRREERQREIQVQHEAFIRDRDATTLRDVERGDSNGIREPSGASAGIRDLLDGTINQNGIREADTTPLKSKMLGAPENLTSAGAQLKSAARHSKSATGLVDEDLKPYRPVAPGSEEARKPFDTTAAYEGGDIHLPASGRTRRTRELLLHIPLEFQKNPKVINLINQFERADMDRVKKTVLLDKIEKEILTDDASDALVAKEKATLLKKQIAADKKIEETLRDDLKGNPEVGWKEVVSSPSPK